MEIELHLAELRPKLLLVAHALLNGGRNFDVDAAAEDAVQDAMLECWARGDLKEWQMRRVTAQRCLDFLKGEGVRACGIHVDPERLATLDVECYSARFNDPRLSECLRVIMRMAPLLRDTMIAYYFDGDTCEELAEACSVQVGTIFRRLSEARAIIRRNVLAGPKVLARSVA